MKYRKAATVPIYLIVCVRAYVCVCVRASLRTGVSTCVRARACMRVNKCHIPDGVRQYMRGVVRV